MTKFERPKFTVFLTEDPEDPDSEVVEHDVTVAYPDQLRAELEAPRQGLPEMSKAPQHHTLLWCWASLVRTGAFVGKFPEFKRRTVHIDTDDEGEAVHPTAPGQDTDSA